MRSSLLTLLILFAVQTSIARQTTEEKEIIDMIESMAEYLPENYDLTEVTSILEDLRRRPIEINKVTAEDLKQLVFLSPLQISSLLNHIRQNGKILDLLELQTVPGFNERVIRMISPFVTVVERNGAAITKFHDAGHDILLRYGRNLKDSVAGAAKYAGSPERMLLRYRLGGTGAWNAGFTVEKDPGERIFGQNSFLPDFISATVSYRGSGTIRQVVLGDYGLQFGQGLTMWTGFSFGKSPDITTTARKESGLRPYYSVNEYAFLRGLAVKVRVLPGADLTVFGSRRALDASTRANEPGEPIGSILQSGLHRTASELKSRHSLNQMIYGGALQYMRGRFELTAVSFVTIFNREIARGESSYDQFRFTGRRLLNGGVAYGYSLKNASISGEISADESGGTAFIHGALVSLTRQVSIGISYRDYATRYQNFFAQGVAESSSTVNERGLYAGLQLHLGKWSVSAYSDWFTFPWLRYRVDMPSDGYEHFAELSWQPDKVSKISLRIKSETKLQNEQDAIFTAYGEDTERSSYRIESRWQLGRSIGIHNRVDVSRYRKTAKPEYGILIYQDLQWSKPFARLSGNMRIAWFKTASYNSRIYAYENDVLYGSGFGIFSGKGVRSYVNFRYKLFGSTDIYFRWGTSWLFQNREESSEMPNTTSDLKVQLRFQFK
ncbi:helix-hairpin-helix domain-containing protein [Pedobacter sp. SYP-B3415]|uniref:ComEA family DNA-binding protein n=1 Tax=Pedobacter sp. SYP-B3415 TaxID=2496641 RepID=UPI00101B84BA|nr:helix-hairpin-helix domain-containing protein [Pedobacter sp. SYP-B3415]